MARVEKIPFFAELMKAIMGTQWEVKRIRTHQHGLNEAQFIEKRP